MNLYDNYSDFFVLLKLVGARGTVREWAICLEVVTRMTISTVSLVKSGCINPTNVLFILSDAVTYVNGTVLFPVLLLRNFTHNVGIAAIGLICAHDSLSDSTIK